MGGRMAGWKRFLGVFLLGSLLLTTGCPERGENQPVARQVKIAVSLADMERDGNQIIKQVIDGRKKQEQVDITWLDAKNKAAEQQKQLQQLAGQGIRTVILQPVDPGAAPGMVRQLAQKNIRVVALESLPPNTPVDAYVASDHQRAGELQARFVEEALKQAAGSGPGPGGAAGGPTGGAGGQGGQPGQGQDAQQGGQSMGQGQGGQPAGGQSSGQGQGGQGQQVFPLVPPGWQLPARRPLNVLILAGDPRDSAARATASAAREALKGNPRVQVVAEVDQPGNDPSAVSPAVQQALAKLNNQIDVILAADSRLAMPAVEVLKAAGLNNRVLTVGVGAGREASRALVAGEHDGEVDNRPDLLGQYALDAAVGLAKTGHWQYDTRVTSGDYSIPARIVPVRLISQANSFLLQERWGKELERKPGGGQDQGGGSPGGDQGGDQGGQQGGDQEGDQGQGGEQGGQASQAGQGGGGQQKPRTTLRITTRDGKTVEVQIQGEVKKIESVEGARPGARQMPSQAGGGGAGGGAGGGGGGAGGGGSSGG
ncbi:MAG: substrate-binding domain-containing protein [Thermoanaerobacteraceae bacterium]|nr:substrate-binding domain-containing protein [Thermoanaerobacteraceae bacterium]